MDNKQALAKRIERIDMPNTSKQIILDYIESHEYGDEMVENVAQLLETIADEADLATEHLTETMNAVEGLRDDVEEMSEEYLKETDEANIKYQDEVNTAMDEWAKGLEAAPASETAAPASEAASPVSEPTTSAEAPVVEAPVVETPVVEATPTAPTPVASVNPVAENAAPAVVDEQPAIQMPWQQNPTGNVAVQ